MMKSSIREVARHCGVSISTVSRVLNGANDIVQPATRDRVLEAVRSLNYRPGPREYSTRPESLTSIGVIASDVELRPFKNHYFRGILEGILVASATNGCSTNIFFERLWDNSHLQIRRSYDGRCDGAIMIAPRIGNSTVRALWERGIPVVVVGATGGFGEVSGIDIDNLKLGIQAVDYLVGLGHRRIAYFGADPATLSSRERGEGYLAGMEKNGLSCFAKCYFAASDVETASQRVIEEDHLQVKVAEDGNVYNLDWGVGLVTQAFSEPNPPTALLCWNDSLACAAIEELRNRGIEVPRHVSVIGVDNSEEAESCDPPLDSFAQPFYEIGKTSVEMLFKLLRPKSAHPIIEKFAPELVIRASSEQVH